MGTGARVASLFCNRFRVLAGCRRHARPAASIPVRDGFDMLLLRQIGRRVNGFLYMLMNMRGPGRTRPITSQAVSSHAVAAFGQYLHFALCEPSGYNRGLAFAAICS